MPHKTKRRPSVSRRLQIAMLVCLAVAAALVAGAALVVQQERVSTAGSVSFTPAPIATQEARVRAAFLGDSYTAGDGAEDRALRWTTQLAGARDWFEINVGFGGTGYGTAGRVPGGEPYFERVDEVVAASPSVVIVSGGRNDYSERTDPAAVAEGITATFTGIREGLPDAQIIALNPLWDDEPAPAELADIGSQVEAAIEAVGGTYVDLGQPLEGQADLLGEDGVHPNNAGYTHLFETINAALPQS